ncbi:MAG: cytochrome c [Bacteroidetes bacterium]|nr:cytochrome c [Bacteroidota bacterium]
MDFFNNQKKLFSTALVLFLGLALIICIFPALQSMSDYQPLPNSKPLTEQEQRGKEIFIAEGCIACHTQQVRNVDMDQVFGNRPSIAADYARNKRENIWQNTANLLGSERTGPDLTNVGSRQPSTDWQYTHLYNPRAVVPESVMPSYKWLFLVKPELGIHDVEVKVPDKFRIGIDGKIVASQDAKDLVAYLLSLKQTELPKSIPPKEFLYKSEKKASTASANGLPDGENLFNTHCATCHQSSGEGVPGAFPPLKGDKVVTGEDLELYITIIMKGYNGLAPAYGVMPPVGTTANLKPEEVAAIINHERTSWGNNGKTTTAEEVKTIMDKIK